ncbi:hypothetical protein [Glacieibacterium sp.]|uniref:hypothetical protein n=1 Tax=Glacieibacterium sp. TaxID=2860237 RepID=UPI003B00C8AE
MTAVPERDVQKLRKIAGLLGSEVDAEAIAALFAARSLAARCGVPLIEALSSALVVAVRARQSSTAWNPEPAPTTAAWVRKVMTCRDAPQLFNSEARDFLRNLSEQRRAPTANQMKWLDDLHDRAIRHFNMGKAA